VSEQAPRSPIHAAVQAAMNHDLARGAQGNVVTGWVCIAESMDPDGRKWLSRISSDASGEQRLPRWTEQGLLHNGLYGNGDDGWDDDDDDASEP
jgi:hypothetical protein